MVTTIRISQDHIQTNAQDEAITYYNEALELMEQEKYSEAIPLLHKAALLDPNEAAIFDRLGTAYFSSGIYPQAIFNHTKAIDLCPSHETEFLAFYYCERALDYYAIGNQAAAINDFKAGARLGESDCQLVLRKWGIPW